MRFVLPPITFLAIGASLTSAQIPTRFENLKHFPTTIARDSLVSSMRSIATSLGVRCQYCHVGGDTITLQGMNFASDEKATKRTARHMLKMVDQINGQLLAGLENRTDPAVSVGCVTCHRGLPLPRTLAQLTMETVRKQGAAAAVQQFRDLRQTGLERGRYDFGEATLNEVSRLLAAGGDIDSAITLLELNAEYFPRSIQVLQSLGDLYRRKNNPAKALDWFEKALQLQPNNQQLQRIVQQLKSGDR